MGSSSILAALSASLSSGTCFSNRLRTFALRKFGIKSYLQAVLITLANLVTIRNRERLLDHQVVRARECICVCV